MKRIVTVLAVVSLLTVALGAQAKPTLRALMVYQPEDYNTYPVAKVLEQMTGYKVNYDALPVDISAAGDKLNLMVASGEPYDFINIPYNTNKAQYAEFARRGALTDLTPLLDQYGPLLKAGTSKINWETVRVNGKIYGIPLGAVAYASHAILIRQDWLDKVGLKAPETFDDFVTVLKAFRDKDPGNNGVQNVPLLLMGTQLDPSIPELNVLASSFGLTNEWNEINDRLVNRLSDPRFADLVAQLQSMYKDGLIDKDLAINKTATIREKFTSGRAGAMIAHWADVPLLLDALGKNQPTAKTQFLKPLKGKSGLQGARLQVGVSMVTVIPKASKNPVETIKYLNMKLQENILRAYTIGEEGKHFSVKDGEYTPILPLFNDDRNRSNNYMTGSNEQIYPAFWQARLRKDPRLFEAFKFINSPKELLVPDWVGFSPFLPNSSKNVAPLNSLVGDTLVRIVVSGDPAKESVDALLKKWKTAGGEVYDKELNAWFGPFQDSVKIKK